jgi:hypothetical protein
MSFLQEARRQARRWGPLAAAGALAGMAAAVPMGLTMLGLNEILPGKRRSWLRTGRALPPRQIYRRVTGRRGGGARWDAATWLGHLGYGAAVASLYPLATNRLRWPVALRGIAFALLVWAGSYLGWLPALGILPPANKMPARRNAIMVLSHVPWGALTSLLTGLLLRAAEKRGLTHLAGGVSAEDAGQSISA